MVGEEGGCARNVPNAVGSRAERVKGDSMTLRRYTQT